MSSIENIIEHRKSMIQRVRFDLHPVDLLETMSDEPKTQTVLNMEHMIRNVKMYQEEFKGYREPKYDHSTGRHFQRIFSDANINSHASRFGFSPSPMGCSDLGDLMSPNISPGLRRFSIQRKPQKYRDL
jgi:hypothetical protein